MTVTVTASVTFEASSTEEARDEIRSWGLPEGANLFVSATENLMQGVVENGELVVPAPPEPLPEPPPEEPAPE
jgi:hypothetical protein